MNTNRLFPQIGKVIASTGSRHFPQMLHELILTQVPVDAIQIRHLRAEAWLAEPEAPTQWRLSRRKDGFRYELTVHRSSAPEGFSAQERSLLEDISPLLLPMVEKHLHALQPPADPTLGLEQLRQRFVERLQGAGLSLSRRELQVSVGLLAGRTAPELAQQLGLKVNTVESYLHRAVIKLGISGRHALMRWMYAEQDEP